MGLLTLSKLHDRKVLKQGLTSETFYLFQSINVVFVKR